MFCRIVFLFWTLFVEFFFLQFLVLCFENPRAAELPPEDLQSIVSDLEKQLAEARRRSEATLYRWKDRWGDGENMEKSGDWCFLNVFLVVSLLSSKLQRDFQGQLGLLSLGILEGTRMKVLISRYFNHIFTIPHFAKTSSGILETKTHVDHALFQEEYWVWIKTNNKSRKTTQGSAAKQVEYSEKLPGGQEAVVIW